MSLSWDDFRLVKAVADRDGLTRAAHELGINHSTAFRRLAGIESSLGTRVFERLRSGYVPTAAGRAMIDAASRMEADVACFDRAVVAQAATPSGELRLTAPAAFVSELLMPLLAAFRARFPAVTLDLVVAEDPLNLSRRDADVAVRATNDPPLNLVGRRLSRIAWAVYARRAGTIPDPERCDWVGLSSQVGDGTFARRLAERAIQGRVVLRLNAVIGVCEAVEAGIGVAYLPCLIADRNPRLRRLREPDPALSSDLWLLTHPDLRHAARVRAFMDFMAEAVAPLRGALEGERAPREEQQRWGGSMDADPARVRVTRPSRSRSPDR